MTVQFYRPSLIVQNISGKAIRLLGLTTILPGQTVDLFDEVDPNTLYEDLILKALEKPWGDLYNEVVIKRSLIIHSLVLSSFHYGIIGPENLNSTNAYFPGAVPAAATGDTFSWIAPAIASVTHPLVISSGNLSIPKADGVTDGYLSKEDWLIFTGNVRPSVKIWQYQDFSAPVGTSVSLSTFQNGTGLSFNASYIINDTAEIVLSSDSSAPPTTTISIPAKYLPSSRVSVTSHIGTTVILSGTPHTTLSCRVYFLIELPAGVSLPAGYQEDPEFLNDSNLEYLDDNYVNQNQDETVFGIKTFADDIIASSDIGIGVVSPAARLDVAGLIKTTDFQLTTGGVDGYYLRSSSTGVGTWYPISGGVTDHGILIGLSDDDHQQYLLLNGGAARNTLTGYLDGYAGRLRLPNSADPQTGIVSPLPQVGEVAFDTNDGYVVVYTNSGWQSVSSAGGGITEVQHDNLDDLVHNLAEDYYEEFTYSGTKVTNITVWTSVAKVLKIRETQFTYSGSKVVTEVNIQYNGIGVEVQRLNATYAYTGSAVSSTTVVEVGG